MTRDQQLKFCKTCVNRKFEPQSGLICGLTNRKADFETECKSYELDNTVVQQLDDQELISPQLAIEKLSEENINSFKAEQDFPKALIVGIAVGVLGAILWAAITVATEYQIGYMAIAIGAAVGFSMRYIGKGIDQIFGVSGAIIAVLSCVLGNFFSIIGFVANSEGFGYFETLMLFDYSMFFSIMGETFSFMDLFFYGIAGYEGYKFAFRTFTEKELFDAEHNNQNTEQL